MKSPSYAAILFISLLFSQSINGQSTERVVVEKEGWELAGDLSMPSSENYPIAILLNQAAGNRQAYKVLAYELLERGIASLRIDLRGHGESINQGKFEPSANNPLIYDAEKDISAIVTYVRQLDGVDQEKIAIVSASYSGEECAESGRKDGYVDAYVVLSPGSFSHQSIEAIDASNSPWLFIIAREDPWLQEIKNEIDKISKKAEVFTFSGKTHATNILENEIYINKFIAAWLAAHL